MKKILPVLIFLFGTAAIQAQVCTPDPTITTPGIYPVNGTSTGFDIIMPDATVGLMYSEEVQIKAPADTVIDTVIGGFPIVQNVTIDSIMIIRFDNLPQSLSYTCDNSRCFWEGGDNGCLVFSGTPTASEVGTYQGEVVGTGWLQPLPVIGILSDTLRFKVTITVKAPQGINEFINANSITIAPNPVTSVSTFSFQALKIESYTFKLVDITGRVVRSNTGMTQIGENRLRIDRQGLPNGMYFYSLEIKGEARSGRMAITH